jgi:hypothetical protein
MSESTDIARQLEKTYDSYIEAFNSEDPEAFAGIYLYPYLELGGAEPVTVFADAEQAKSYLVASLQAMKDGGWASTTVDEATGIPLAHNAGLLMVRVSQFGRDGSLLRTVQVLYTLALAKGGWKFVSYVYMGDGFSLPLTAKDA